tara:strand:+ start:2092 stop:2610 length:519 start_codon:yes stop_codon:yes gene_type:complete
MKKETKLIIGGGVLLLIIYKKSQQKNKSDAGIGNIEDDAYDIKWMLSDFGLRFKDMEDEDADEWEILEKYPASIVKNKAGYKYSDEGYISEYELSYFEEFFTGAVTGAKHSIKLTHGLNFSYYKPKLEIKDTEDDNYKYVNFSLQFNSKKDLNFFQAQLKELHREYWSEAYD